VLITVVFCRFNLRPTLSLLFSLLFLTHFISPITSSFLSTIRVVSSAYVMVFIFHVTFLTPTPPPDFVMYSLYRINRTGDKMQPYLTPFWIGYHSVVPWSTCSLAPYSVCRYHINTVICLVILTLLMLFHIFRCCTLSKSLCNL
jgi:hypothetical protein